MKLIPILLAIVGAIIGVFYALESYLTYQSNGITVQLFVKLAICILGCYFFWRNIQRIRQRGRHES